MIPIVLRDGHGFDWHDFKKLLAVIRKLSVNRQKDQLVKERVA